MFEYHLTFVVGHIFLTVLKVISFICIPLLTTLLFTWLFDNLINYLGDKFNLDVDEFYLTGAIIAVQLLGLVAGFFIVKLLGVA